MNEPVQYAVFLFPTALAELGEALAPYLQDGPSGRHVLCSEIDSGGALFEMTVHAVDEAGAVLDLELMIPVGMIKLVIAVQQDARFGFARRPKPALERSSEPPTMAVDPEPAGP